MSQKKWMNIGGVAIFVAFMLVVVIYKSVEFQNMNAEARQTATELAQAFAAEDAKVIGKWAQRDYVDPWKGQYVLVSNTHSTGTVVASMGPDGELGTKDDVVCDPVPVLRPKRVFIKKPEPKKKVVEQVKEKSSGIIDKVKGFFGGGKDEPTDVRDDQT